MTLREHLEAIRDLDVGDGPGLAQDHAVLALAILDAAETFKLSIEGQVHLPMRGVYDPEPTA